MFSKVLKYIKLKKNASKRFYSYQRLDKIKKYNYNYTRTKSRLFDITFGFLIGVVANSCFQELRDFKTWHPI